MTFVEVVQQFGFPVGCVLFLGLAIWSVGRWAAKNIAEPVAQRHMAFLDSVIASNYVNRDTLNKLSDAMDKQASTMDKMADDVQELRVHFSLKSPPPP